jgi:hypothetical protein
MKSARTLTEGGNTYTIAMFGASVGCGIMARLAKVFAPALEEMGDATVDQAAAAKLGAKAFSKIGQQLHAPDVVTLVKDLMQVVTIDGAGNAKDAFDFHFAGKYGELAAVCMAVVEHNGFFEALGFGASAAEA